MQYYRDREGDIWKWSDDYTMSSVFDVLAQTWDSEEIEKCDAFEACDKNWDLTKITDGEFFLEFI